MKIIRYVTALTLALALSALSAHAQTLRLDSKTETSAEVKTRDAEKDADASIWIRVQQELSELEIELDEAEEETEVEIRSNAEVETNVSAEGDPDRPLIEGNVPATETDVSITIEDEEEVYRPVIKGTVEVEAAGVYLKVGDIKGESLDNEHENAADALSVNETIEINGVEVRGWNPQTKKEITNAAPKDADSVETDADLAFFAAVYASEDVRMESVSFNYGKIKWEYQSQGKLFGFIPVAFTSEVEAELIGPDGQEVGADKFRRVKVRYPWYRFIMKSGVPRAELEEELNVALEAEAGAGAQIAPSQTKVVVLAQAFQTLSNILKTKHDTTMASTKNTR